MAPNRTRFQYSAPLKQYSLLADAVDTEKQLYYQPLFKNGIRSGVGTSAKTSVSAMFLWVL